MPTASVQVQPELQTPRGGVLQVEALVRQVTEGDVVDLVLDAEPALEPALVLAHGSARIQAQALRQGLLDVDGERARGVGREVQVDVQGVLQRRLDQAQDRIEERAERRLGAASSF